MARIGLGEMVEVGEILGQEEEEEEDVPDTSLGPYLLPSLLTTFLNSFHTLVVRSCAAS